jgi:hypothetical protein
VSTVSHLPLIEKNVQVSFDFEQLTDNSVAANKVVNGRGQSER